MSSPAKRKHSRITAEVRGLESSPGFKAALEAKTSSMPDDPATEGGSGSKHPTGGEMNGNGSPHKPKRAKHSVPAQVEEEEEDELYNDDELEADIGPKFSKVKKPSARRPRNDAEGSRNNGQTTIPNITPSTSQKPTPAKEIIFVTVDDPRTLPKAKSKKSPSKSIAAPNKVENDPQTPSKRGRGRASGSRSRKSDGDGAGHDEGDDGASSPTKASQGRRRSTQLRRAGSKARKGEDHQDDALQDTPSKSRGRPLLARSVGGSSKRAGRSASRASMSEPDNEFLVVNRDIPARWPTDDEEEVDGDHTTEPDTNVEEMDEEDEVDELESSGSSNEDGDRQTSISPTKRTPSKALIKDKGRDLHEDTPRFITQTAYDVYFQTIAQSSKTSNSVFSNLLPTFTYDEYTNLLRLSPVSPIAHPNAYPHFKHATQLKALRDSHNSYFGRYLVELQEGFNLLFYGFGSKREVLNDFAKTTCAKVGDVIVLNGFRVTVGLKTLLNKIDSLIASHRGNGGDDELKVINPGNSGASALTPLEAQALQIYKHYLPSASSIAPRPLFIIIHSIDSPHMRLQKVQSVLGLLASNPRIHLAASIDHMNAPLIWTQSQALGRGHDSFRRVVKPGTRKASALWDSSDEDESDDEAEIDSDEDEGGGSDQTSNAPSLPTQTAVPSERNFTWLWHDLTTFAHYDVELEGLQRDVTSLVVSGSGKPKFSSSSGLASGRGGPAEHAGPLTEAGAQHVLSGVTERSRNLFIILGRKQLANIDAEVEEAPINNEEIKKPSTLNIPASQMNRFAVPYEQIFTVARERFYATSDQGLRGLLGEFKDHGMILTGVVPGSTAGEVVWIPLSKSVLERILEEMPDI